MQASRRRYSELVGGSVQFVIPVFQRDYNWEEEQCQQLWDDIERIGHSGEGDHLFGPVVYIATEDQGAAFTQWLLIDGQQRMTTMSLLMAAVRDHIREDSSQSDVRAATGIDNNFLLNMYEEEGRRRKLVLRERDDETLRGLVEGGEEPGREAQSQTVFQNYQFFRERLRDVGVDVVTQGVGRLVVVDVRLERGTDDPQQIYESLNSTGLDLTQADLVRNYVLIGLDQAEQRDLYENYWRKIERLFASSPGQLDNFLRDFVALDTRAQKQGRVDRVYATFRFTFDECKSDPVKLKKLLQRMWRFGRYHAAFVMGTQEFDELKDRLSRVRALATTPAILVMRLFDAYENQQMAVSDLKEALDLLESYLVRRDVCGLQTRSYWRQFSRLAYELDGNDILGSLKVKLHLLSDKNYAFPSDRDFRYALEEEELYGRQICRTLLERLENGQSREWTDTSSCTIEHIMPQNKNLNSEWQEMLGADWKEVQETWLHRLGNLTLTAYNEPYSDNSFEDKKSMPNGFRDSPLRLNQFVAQQDQWTFKEMEQRGALLAEQALTIWSQLEVSEEALLHAEVRDLHDQGGDVEITRREMDDVARDVFDKFRCRMLEEDVIEVAMPKSVSYHNSNAELVCEVLPRTQRILVLFSVEIGEAVACRLDVHDTGDYKFIPHAQYDTGCFVNIYTPEEVGACDPLLRQALAMSMD